MKCKNCGYEITEDTVFCFNCGSKVESLIISNDSQNNEENTDKNKNLNLFNVKLDKIKEDTYNFSKSTKNFIENTGNSIFHKYSDSNTEKLEKYSYEDTLNYLRKNHSTKIEFPASNKETENKLNELLSGEVIGSGVGLVGAAASIGLIGTTLGAGLIIIGAGALIGGVISRNYSNMAWVPSELFIRDNELVFSGKFSLHYDEIKYVDAKTQQDNEIVVLTLKENALEFRTYNALALKTVIDEKMDEYSA